MTTLMVTPYPPYRDGIGAYAVQEVRRMRAAGDDVEVLSPLPSAAQHHLALGGLPGVLALVKRAGCYESVIIQFSPEMLFGACHGPLERMAVWAGIEALSHRTKVEIRLHEIELGPLERNPAERRIAARALRAASVVAVHTRPEIDNLGRVLGLSASHVSLVEHGQNFTMATTMSRSEARVELGLNQAEHVFLAIGFLQEHKGFDLAALAFGRTNLGSQASLHIVGSVRVGHPDLIRYARRLTRLCHATAGVTLHEKYVSDEEFDRWIVAADTIVLPYREIWSSSVIERGKLYERPIIAADVGGMGDQAPPGTLFFDDGESLIQAFKVRAQATEGREVEDPVPAPVVAEKPAALELEWDVNVELPDRGQVEAQIRARVRAQNLHGAAHHGAGVGSAASAVESLIGIGRLQRPDTVSARPGISQLKRLVRRVTRWEVDPIVSQLETLQRATIEAIAELEARVEGARGRGYDR